MLKSKRISRFKKIAGLKKRKSIFSTQTFGLLLLILGAVLALFLFFLLSGIFNLRNITITAETGIPEKEIKGIIERGVNKKFFDWFSVKPIFLISSAKIENEILKKYPQAESAELKKIFPHDLSLTIKKRTAAGVWCWNGKNSCFLFDKETIIFEKTESQNGLILILSEEEGKLGQKMLDEPTFKQILEINRGILQAGLKAASFYLSSVPVKEITVNTEEDWKIYFDPAKDITLALAKLEVLLKKEIPPENRGKLQYIDLRFTKAYYK